MSKSNDNTPKITPEQIEAALVNLMKDDKLKLGKVTEKLLAAQLDALFTHNGWEIPDDCVVGKVSNRLNAIQARVDALTEQMVTLNNRMNDKPAAPKQTPAKIVKPVEKAEPEDNAGRVDAMKHAGKAKK